MDQQPPQAAPAEAPPQTPKRGSWVGAVLVLLAIGGSAVGVLVYQAMQGKEKPVTDTSGFDLAQVSDASPRPAAPSGAAAPSQQSGLGMVQTGMTGMQFGQKSGQPPSQPTAQQKAGSLAELIRVSEAKVQKLARQYTKKYPVFMQYSREWMSHPDLKKLNDDYMKNHDPIAFARGLAESKNFGGMVRKYGTNPQLQAFAKDVITHAPPQIMSGVADYLKDDKVVKRLVDIVGSAMGLPAGMLTGGSDGKVDEKAVMDGIMKNNPDAAKAMSDPNIQKAVGDPNARQKIQGR